MMKKSAVLLLSSAMLFTSLGVASASPSQVSSTSINDVIVPAEVDTISVRDVIPAEYFEAAKGKYQSKEDILKDTGFTPVKTGRASTMQYDNGAIIVNDLDEYAALLTYYSDNNNQTIASNQTFEGSSNQISPMAIVTDSVTQTVWGDGLAAGANLSWISATVSFNRHDSAGNWNIVSVTDSSSSLLGFHPGNSWQHDRAATNATANVNGRTAQIIIKGVRTLSIIGGGGIGEEIISRPQSFSMRWTT
ncbi:hypothetical protein [Paenibacillus lautus]|uniref:hypothetical protein n=1 Tax=Paenibacillus lautus TaxID=1401 RepID=UPI003D297165